LGAGTIKAFSFSFIQTTERRQKQGCYSARLEKRRKNGASGSATFVDQSAKDQPG